MYSIVITAFALGLSTGLSCVMACAPLFIPYLIGDDRGLKRNSIEFVLFMLGRLCGYLLFGIVIGYLGQKFNYGLINYFGTVMLLVLSVLMILYSLNFFNKWNVCSLKIVKGAKFARLPFWIGIFTGVNLCPPFLAALDYVFLMGNVWKGIIFFLSFFIATNVYLIPIIFFGWLGKIYEFRKFARITMFLVGLMFLFYALHNLILQ